MWYFSSGTIPNTEGFGAKLNIYTYIGFCLVLKMEMNQLLKHWTLDVYFLKGCEEGRMLKKNHSHLEY